MSITQCPSGRRRWPALEAIQTSKRFLAGGQEATACRYGCGGYHLEPAKGATAGTKPKPARTTGLRQVSRKRAAEIRERRTMLQAKYPGVTLCEVPYCNRVADDAHEPLTRARSGSITDPGNVKAVCRPHHDEITFEEPGWAYQLGFLVHSWGAA